MNNLTNKIKSLKKNRINKLKIKQITKPFISTEWDMVTKSYEQNDK